MSDLQYQAFRESAIDRDDFFPTYLQWVDAAMEHEYQSGKRGIIITRIRMDFQDFQRWCIERGYQNDYRGRCTYAERRAQAILGS
jgi:hypothetical protein